MKTCTKCKITKESTEFYPHKQTKDGLKSHCKSCNIKQYKVYSQKNKKKIKQWQEEWAKNNPDRDKQNRQRHKDNNKEKMREYDRVWKNEKYQNDNDSKQTKK